jgi:hypothetical protein
VTTRDDELLDVLATSLGPPPDAEPSWAELSHLHRVLDSGYAGRRPSRTPVWRFRRPLTAAMAGFLVLGGASAAAAASGAVMPQPMRVAARAVGLPVESPDLADARAALARLRAALAAKPPDLNAIRMRAQDVRDRLARLSADDRSHVEDEAGFLLAEADTALAPPPAPLGSPSASSPEPAAASAGTTAAPTAAPTGDDHGRRSGDDAAEPEHNADGSGEHPSVDDHSGSSGPGPSASSDNGGNGGSGGDDHTATTQRVDNSGRGSSDGGGGGSDGGSSHDGGGSSDGGGSDGGGHSGPG